MHNDIALNNLKVACENIEKEFTNLKNLVDKKVGREDVEYIKIKDNLDNLSKTIHEHKAILEGFKYSIKDLNIKMDSNSDKINKSNVMLGKHTEILNQISSNLTDLNNTMNKVNEETIKNSGTSYYVRQGFVAIIVFILGACLTALGLK